MNKKIKFVDVIIFLAISVALIFSLVYTYSPKPGYAILAISGWIGFVFGATQTNQP